jgi:hypothetical protein
MVLEAVANDVQRIGLNCIGFPPECTRQHHETTNMKPFESAYGINPQIACIVFQEIHTRDIGNKASINQDFAIFNGPLLVEEIPCLVCLTTMKTLLESGYGYTVKQSKL